MNNYRYLEVLEVEGTLNQLTRRGMLPKSLIRYRQMKIDFDKSLEELQIETKVKEQRDNAVIEVAEKHGVTKAVVYNALRIMRQECD